MNDIRLPKILLHAECESGQRDTGQPPISFRTCVKKDMISFGISIYKWQSLATDRKVWRKLIYDGKLKFLNRWWEEWIKKYYVRRKRNKVEEISKATLSNENNSDFRLRQIMLKDKLIPSSSKSDTSEINNKAISIVRRVVEVNLCLQNMLPLVTQKCQFDILDEAVANMHISDKRQRKRVKTEYKESEWL